MICYLMEGGFEKNEGNFTWPWINIATALIFAALRKKMEAGTLDRDRGFTRHERKHCGIADRWFQNQRQEM